MRIRRLLVVVFAIALILALAPAPPAQGLTATLIDIDEIHPARDHAKPPGVANCSNDDPTKYTGLYETTGWVAEGPTTAHLNTASVPSSLGDVTTMMQASYDAWAAAGVPAYTVATDGTVTRATANRQDDVLFGRTGGSIATTYTWRWSDGLIESDVVFNKGYGWFTASSEGDGCSEDAGSNYDVANIAVHEFGHVYGLGHAPDSRFESMYAYGFTGETLKRSPATGDQNGIVALY